MPGAVGDGASEGTIGRPWGEATSGPYPKGYVLCRSGIAGSPRARALLTIAEKDRKQRDLRLGGAAERGKLLSLLAGRPLPSSHHPVGSRGREGCGRKETQIPQQLADADVPLKLVHQSNGGHSWVALDAGRRRASP